MANKRFNQITRVVTSFDSDDVLPLGNGTLGDGKMSKDTLLELTAQNALNSIHLLSDTANEADIVEGNSFFALSGVIPKKLPADAVAKSVELAEKKSLVITDRVYGPEDEFQYGLTDFIPCAKYDVVHLNWIPTSTVQIASLYDSSKTFLRYINKTNFTPAEDCITSINAYQCEIPYDCAYIRFVSYKAQTSSFKCGVIPKEVFSQYKEVFNLGLLNGEKASVFITDRVSYPANEYEYGRTDYIPCKVNDVLHINWLPSSDAIIAYLFDSSKVLVRNLTKSDFIPSGGGVANINSYQGKILVDCAYVIFVSYKAQTSDFKCGVIPYEVYGAYNAKSFKDRPSNGVVIFDTKLNSSDDTGITDYFDKAILLLPTSYNANGKKTRLIIINHGSGVTITDDSGMNYMSFASFFVRMGYAVLDCNGGYADGKHFGSPLGVQAYIKAYRYAIENYNLYEDVFVLSGSMGGLVGFNLIYSGAIKVIAHACYFPIVNLYWQAYVYPWDEENGDWSVNRRKIAQRYGFDDFDSFDGWQPARVASTEEKEYFLDNIQKTVGYNPICENVINWEDSIFAIQNEDNRDENYRRLRKLYSVPLKIWHAKDDTIASYLYSEYVVEAIRKCYGKAEIRYFETGGHTSWLGDSFYVTDIDGNSVLTYDNWYETYNYFKRYDN